jgi:hypothetical protein
MQRIGPAKTKHQTRGYPPPDPLCRGRRSIARVFQPITPIEFKIDICMETERRLEDLAEDLIYLATHNGASIPQRDEEWQHWHKVHFGTRSYLTILEVHFEAHGRFLAETQEEAATVPVLPKSSNYSALTVVFVNCIDAFEFNSEYKESTMKSNASGIMSLFLPDVGSSLSSISVIGEDLPIADIMKEVPNYRLPLLVC